MGEVSASEVRAAVAEIMGNSPISTYQKVVWEMEEHGKKGKFLLKENRQVICKDMFRDDARFVLALVNNYGVIVDALNNLSKLNK